MLRAPVCTLRVVLIREREWCWHLKSAQDRNSMSRKTLPFSTGQVNSLVNARLDGHWERVVSPIPVPPAHQPWLHFSRQHQV